MRKLLKMRISSEFKELDEDDIVDWIDEPCGTIHTFQGKEANEVILILGCSIGAVEWASKKPNILNVAVTRAKYRIAVIGDGNLWGKFPYFDFAYKILSEE